MYQRRQLVTRLRRRYLASWIWRAARSSPARRYTAASCSYGWGRDPSWAPPGFRRPAESGVVELHAAIHVSADRAYLPDGHEPVIAIEAARDLGSVEP